ncbi:DUF1796 family putative cysteine peptidase [Paenibacillus sp. FJAT-26967]|uniref:DUF1796 family putative cysteine peptidase n=1 Tax=Paenibacillus sp. FJAT-26967 TaxID=1729690 RepID=UPI0008396632|nr:DUF1796 family putative cysteine peptidase [Paenibacillus sp. FJAT-26967]
MRLKDLAGTYDSVFSLGQNCLPAIQMEKHGLRSSAGVLDWMISDSLTDVNRLLGRQFDGFMALHNMSVVEPDTLQPNYQVKDSAYQVISVHDFPVTRNSPQHLYTYREFKEKLDRRINRFLKKIKEDEQILFIRMHGTYEETAELEQVLSGLVTHDFKVLLVEYDQVQGIVELDWALPRTCAVQVPYADIWNFNSDKWWEALFTDIHAR